MSDNDVVTAAKDEAGGQLAPVLPLRDIVVFPHMIVPLFVGREKSVRALEEVMNDEKQILLLTQKNAADDDPTPDGLHTIGTLATVLQLLKLPDQTVRVLVEGKSRAAGDRLHGAPGFLPGQDRTRRRDRRRSARDRSADAHGQDQFRAVHQAQQEGAGRDAGLGRADRGPGQARRHRRLASVGEDSRPPAASRDAQHHRAAGARAVADRSRDRRAAGRAQDPQPRQAPDGEDAARVLSQRTAQGDPEGAGRGRGRPRRAQRTRRAHPQDQAVEGSAREGQRRDEEAPRR